MSKALVLFAPGFEEVEGLTIVDVLRRGQVTVHTCAVTPTDKQVIGAHQVPVQMDTHFSEIVNAQDYDAIILPGGMDNALTLRDTPAVLELFRNFHNQGKLVAAICASPIVLSKAGITGQHAGTCYPGLEDQAQFSSHQNDKVVCDKNMITSRGPGTSFDFAFALLEKLAGETCAKTVKSDMLLT